MPDTLDPILCLEGPDALLISAQPGAFSDAVQLKVWSLALALRSFPGVAETVPGMNNLMVVFDALSISIEALEREIVTLWRDEASHAEAGAIRDVPVRYGGADGPDLEAFAAAKGMTAGDIIARHCEPLYSVAAVGAMPGFVYLSGLDPVLAMPRLSNPRSGVLVGSVIVGGAQAGIMPVTAPSGWHILGRTDLSLFNPHRGRPALFAPGDRIRFVVENADA